MWLSVFRVPAGAGVEPGVYGVAFVSYEPPGVLSYRELLVARLLDTRRRRVRITDIWVDDETSRAGGRVLWAIPKELADFDLEETRVGPTAHTALAARADEVTVASAQFASAPGAALVRAPFAATLVQPRDGRDLLTPWRGSAKSLPALGSWEFDPSGPLAFLQGRRPLVSFRLTDVRLVFG